MKPAQPDTAAQPANEIPRADPQAVAERVGRVMYERDTATRALGMQILSIGPGRATLSMTVRGDMLNGHHTCHGGFITTLADSAFAFACNSYDELTVASGISVDFLAPGRAGDVLTATALESSKSGRTGVYDVTVTNQRGERIALFRGRSYTMKGKPAIPPGVAPSA